MSDPSAGSSMSPELIAFATRLFDAARQGQVELFEQALPRGVPVNMTNDKGDSLIMLSAYHGHASLVRLLLSHGADPNRLNDRMQSPLAGAVFKNETDVIEALLEGGADPDIGQPSAMDAVGMFGLDVVWKHRFESAKGKGKGNVQEQPGQAPMPVEKTKGPV